MVTRAQLEKLSTRLDARAKCLGAGDDDLPEELSPLTMGLGEITPEEFRIRSLHDAWIKRKLARGEPIEHVVTWVFE